MLININPDQVDDAKRILTWLCFSRRPVTLQEIVEGLTVVDLGENPRLDPECRLEDTDEVIRICPGLISISTIDDGSTLVLDQAIKSPVVRIAHFSVQEYLESSRIQSSKASVFALKSLTANIELATICLIYLRHVQITDLDAFPLATYAAEYWFQHFRTGDEKSDTLNLLATEFLRFKNDAFENWIRVFDPRMGRGLLDMCSEKIPPPVYYASLLGLYQPLRTLLESDLTRNTINEETGRSGNALVAASERGHEQVVRLLLNNGAGVDIECRRHGTALQVASFEGHDKVVQLLLQNRARVDTEAGRSGNALLAASRRGHTKVIQLLLDNGADANTESKNFLGTAIQAASVGGHEKAIQLLLDNGVGVNDHTKGHYGGALQAASFGGFVEAVKVLLDNGAEVNAQERGFYGYALQAASAAGQHQIVKVLLEKGAEIDAQGGYYGTALRAASAEGEEETVQFLLDKGADIDAHGKNGNALEAASRGGHEKVTQILLDRGAKDTGSVLFEAAIVGDVGMIQLLQDRGAEIITSKAIKVASREGDEEVVKLLLERIEALKSLTT
jgi:ankyrin repeat domain-containing protein 50